MQTQLRFKNLFEIAFTLSTLHLGLFGTQNAHAVHLQIAEIDRLLVEIDQKLKDQPLTSARIHSLVNDSLMFGYLFGRETVRFKELSRGLPGLYDPDGFYQRGPLFEEWRLRYQRAFHGPISRLEELTRGIDTEITTISKQSRFSDAIKQRLYKGLLEKVRLSGQIFMVINNEVLSSDAAHTPVHDPHTPEATAERLRAENLMRAHALLRQRLSPLIGPLPPLDACRGPLHSGA